jgi:hypothetical protein
VIGEVCTWTCHGPALAHLKELNESIIGFPLEVGLGSSLVLNEGNVLDLRVYWGMCPRRRGVALAQNFDHEDDD